MDGYIKKSEAVDVIVKYPYEIAGKTATAIKMIEDLPSANVVPKSELEISQHLLKDAWTRIEELDKLCGELQKAKTEYASEIFEEIETVLCYSVRPRINANGTITPIKSRDLHIRTEDYNTIKKKYTEGEQ